MQKLDRIQRSNYGAVNVLEDTRGINMKFTTDGYIELIKLLSENDYKMANYYNWQEYEKCVILRHDVDFDLQQAFEMAKLESRYGIQSTYFILLTGSFYNIYSYKNRSIVKSIQNMGHTIGLHFDEMVYPEDVGIVDRIEKDIRKELRILSDAFDTNVTIFSYHRPSGLILDSNIRLHGSVNSYGDIFFQQFKYLSDSRMNWREPVMDIIEGKQYQRLHILTHPFWYRDSEIGIKEILREFLKRAVMERYNFLNDNFTSLGNIIRREDMNL